MVLHVHLVVFFSLCALYIIVFFCFVLNQVRKLSTFLYSVYVWFLFSYKILGLKAAKSFFCVYVWVWFYAWFRSFKAVEVKFWSFLECLCECFVFFSVGLWYLSDVKIFTFLLSRYTCVQPKQGNSIQIQWTCVKFNPRIKMFELISTTCSSDLAN